MNCGLQSAPASISVLLLLLSATLFVLADGPVNATLEDAPMWFAMTEIPAQAYARAHAVWRQWLRHWHLTGDPRALRTTLVCQQIAEEKMAAWQAEGIAQQMQPSRYRPVPLEACDGVACAGAVAGLSHQNPAASG
jgi:hypothetical protein